MSPERIDFLERDVQGHARIITEYNGKISAISKGIEEISAEMDKDKAVQEVRDEYLEKRLTGIENSIKAVYKLGWWVLAAFGSSAVALIANFVFKGGLVIGQ
ncbi:hypothetical protein [Neorhizobium sp. T6_25]|jgi:hypothetical protein|uniref:hypothetical protein n=1 Tax=Neorhizobium sp. T6_25 TaxID=2093833 RepID=UPI000CFA114E|nr:hypothetical protein [Neorhizobium sp. T6_25]